MVPDGETVAVELPGRANGPVSNISPKVAEVLEDLMSVGQCLNGGFLGVPTTLLRDNQMECEDLEVQVQLPVLGLTDVLPFPGEVVLGDVCIDH